MSLSMNRPSKAVLLAAVAVLAACSRNPKPGVDETGRADTTMVDTSRARADTAAVQPYPRDTLIRPDTGMRRDTSAVLPKVPAPDTLARPDTSMRRDTSMVPPTDTSRMRRDSAAVRDTTSVQRDTTSIPRNVPDTTNSQNPRP